MARIRETTGAVLAGREDSAVGKVWRVTLIRSGLSLNGNYYPADVLARDAHLFEGAPVGVYSNGAGADLLDLGHLPPPVYEVAPGIPVHFVGAYRNVAVEQRGGRTEITADMCLFDGLERLGARIVEWAKAGWFDGADPRIGFSVDVNVEAHEGIAESRRCNLVDAVTKVTSVDVVCDPAAGGHFERLVAALTTADRNRSNMTVREAVLKALQKAIGDKDAARKCEGVTDDKAAVAILLANLPKRASEMGAGLVKKIAAAVEAGNSELALALLETLAEMVPGAEAPVPAEEKAPATATESVDAKITEAVTKALAPVLARLDAASVRTAEAVPGGMGDSGTADPARSDVVVGMTEEEVKLIACDKAFGLDPNRLPDDYGMARFGRGRASEAVFKRQQDRAMKGLFVGGGSLDDARDRYSKVRAPESIAALCQVLSGFGVGAVGSRAFNRASESIHDRMEAPLVALKRGMIPATSKRYTEAITVTQAIYGTLLSSSAHRALVAEYRAIPEFWSKFCVAGSASDFKAVSVINPGHFPALTTLANDQTSYTDLIGNTARTLESNDVTVARHGNLLGVTEVALRNDDLSVIQRTVRLLGEASKRTLEQYAHDLLLAHTSAINDTNYSDAKLIYHADHGNISSTAMSQDGLTILRRQMMAQTDPQALQTLMLVPELLIVPIALEESTYRVVNSEQVAGNANNDRNMHFQEFEVVVSPYMRGDATNYAGVANPRVAEGIRINFLDGVTEPEIFINDTATVGRVFTDDESQWKVKFPFGGKVIDYRPLQLAVVAG